jgi:hypothetical protein
MTALLIETPRKLLELMEHFDGFPSKAVKLLTQKKCEKYFRGNCNPRPVRHLHDIIGNFISATAR